MKNCIYSLFVVILMSAFCAQAQQVRTDFGKNRVQFNQDFREWLQYESPNFTAYWYGPARNVGQAAVQFAEYDNLEVQNLLEHKINYKIEIVVYTDLTDVKQSNMGEEDVFNINSSEHPMAMLEMSQGTRLASNVDAAQVLNGRVNGNKIFVYFDGNHQHLRRQIREGLAGVYLNSMLFGSNLQEMVQNAVSYSLPQWYKQGIASYIAEPWDVSMDNVLKDIILHPKFDGFKRFAKRNPQLAGHSFWYFLSQTYGRQTLSSLLYLTRINRNMESGFQYILGGNTTKIYESWESFYRDRFEADQRDKESFAEAMKIKYKGKIPVTTAKISPDGQQMAYVTNEAGRCRVFVQDIQGGSRKRIKKTGFYNALQTTDYDYAIIAWKPNGQELSIAYEQRDIRKLFTYNFKDKKGSTELLSPDFQRIYNMDYLSNSELAMSATTNGFSDIFIYKPISRTYQRITNDFYDDLDVAATRIKGEKGLFWASNRPDTNLIASKMDSILPIQNFDVFFLNLEKRDKGLVQITQTPYYNERQPIGIDSTYFAYLNEENGVFNRDIAYLDTIFDHNRTVILYKDGARQQLEKEVRLTAKDSTIIDTLWTIPIFRTVAFPHHSTNYTRNILAHHTTRQGNFIDLAMENRAFRVSVKKENLDNAVVITNTAFRQLQLLKAAKKGGKEELKALEELRRTSFVNAAIKDTVIPKPNLYLDYFQSEFANPLPKEKEKEVANANSAITDNILKNNLMDTYVKKEMHKFRGTRVIPYRFKFRTDDISLLKFDSNPIINQADLMLGGYGTPPLGLLSKVTFKELLEDYSVEIGGRFTLLINGQFNSLGSTSSVTPIAQTKNAEPPSYNSTEYYIAFSNRKRRFDKKYTLYHKANNYLQLVQNTDVYKSRLISDIGQFELRIPTDIYNSFRLTTTLRLDKFVYLSTDTISLRKPVRNEQRLGLRADYIHDNILMIANNMPIGRRFKLYVEAYKGANVQLRGERAFDLANGFMTNIGFDARHYQRLDKKSIVALRLTGATSWGTERTLYMIGGVEGGIRPALGSNLSIPGDNYSFLIQAAQMRGFNGNIRNGNSMLLFNSELRVPMIQYVFPNVRATWLKNLQFTGFFDAGTAWQDKKLFSTDNPLNTVILPEENPQSSVSIKVNYFRDPIVMGTGFGARTSLMGYFFKFDYAWGIETRVIQAPVKHFSVGLDF